MTKEKKKKKDKDKKQKLPEPLETQRHYVLCGPDQNSHVGATSSGLPWDSAGPPAVTAFHQLCQQGWECMDECCRQQQACTTGAMPHHST